MQTPTDPNSIQVDIAELSPLKNKEFQAYLKRHPDVMQSLNGIKYLVHVWNRCHTKLSEQVFLLYNE